MKRLMGLWFKFIEVILIMRRFEEVFLVVNGNYGLLFGSFWFGVSINNCVGRRCFV